MECKSLPSDNFGNFMGKDFEISYSWSPSKTIDHVIDQGKFQDTNTKSNSIEEENDEKTHAQTSFIEIQETEAFNKEESEDKSAEESAACFGKQDQKIDEESASVIELNNSVSSEECMRISSKDIQVNEMEEEATIEKQHCSVESDDSSNITESVPSYEIRRVDIAEEKWNSQNIIEVMDQVSLCNNNHPSTLTSSQISSFSTAYNDKKYCLLYYS